jgi:IS5 family transposase
LPESSRILAKGGKFTRQPEPSQAVQRNRLESDGIEKMLQALLATALRTGGVDQRDLVQVNVDPTVQEKAIAFPTDARLYHKL